MGRGAPPARPGPSLCERPPALPAALARGGCFPSGVNPRSLLFHPLTGSGKCSEVASSPLFPHLGIAVLMIQFTGDRIFVFFLWKIPTWSPEQPSLDCCWLRHRSFWLSTSKKILLSRLILEQENGVSVKRNFWDLGKLSASFVFLSSKPRIF